MREPVDLHSAAEGTPNVVELTIPSRAEWVGVARLAVAGIASRLQFSIEDIEDLKLAVAEACTNCIQHASSGEAVRISCAIHPDKIVVTVQDSGKGFSGGELAPKELGVGLERSELVQDETAVNAPVDGVGFVEGEIHPGVAAQE